jgi:hypothetical protein
MSEDDKAISESAPSYSLSKVISTLRKKGFVKALDDPEQGPHVHLTLLLATVFVVSIIIIAVTQFIL